MYKSPKLIAELVLLLNEGWTIGAACKERRVPISNFYAWKQTNPELSVNREEILIKRLIEHIEEWPESTVQEICDDCLVHPTTFYKYLRHSPSLRETFSTLRRSRSKKTGFKSFYAEQLAKNGYSTERIRRIMGYRVAPSEAIYG